jgi:hypothetical protein
MCPDCPSLKDRGLLSLRLLAATAVCLAAYLAIVAITLFHCLHLSNLQFVALLDKGYRDVSA